MKNGDNTNFVCVLKTGKLFEHDIASDALKERKIPFYKQLETSIGYAFSAINGSWHMVQYFSPS
jgi:hypothetical protein